jgi:hypothetical protein
MERNAEHPIICNKETQFMATLDIRGTVVGETAIAIKAPVLVATTANITLSGVQTIDGVSVGNNSERVLVKNQTTQTQNGIYIASTGAWVLAADFTNNNNVALGTLVLVTSGNVNAGLIFEQTNADNPIVIGTSLIAFTALPNATAQAATSTTSLTIGTGAKTLTIQSGKSFVANQYVVIYETSAPATNSMLATVTSYTGTSLVVNVVATTGSGIFMDWSIVLTNSPAGAGIQPPVGSGNVTGPGSSVDTHVATFSGTTGKIIQDGGALGTMAALSSLTAQYLATSAAAFGVNMLNGQILATASAGTLTVAVKTLAGADPSPSDPVWFMFRSATAAPTNAATTPLYQVIEVTAALNMAIAAETLGFQNNTPGRLWVTSINDGGTVSLALINCLSGTSIFPLAGWGIAATVTQQTGGLNTPQIFVGAANHSNVPYSVLGYIAWEAPVTMTAGTWVAPSRVELYRPGVSLPGQVVQSVSNSTTTGGTTTAASFTTLTSGQTLNITPSSSVNLIRHSLVGSMNLSGAADAYIQIKRGSTLVGVAFRSNVDAAWASPCSLAAVDTPYSLSAVN